MLTEDFKLASFCLTEPDAGSDVSGMRTNAVRKGDKYVINGSKCFITNGGYADWYTVYAKTDPDAGHKGISLLAAEKDAPGVTIGRDLDKLGYKGIETCEVTFEDFRVPVASLVGGVEGKGLQHVLSGLDGVPVHLQGVVAVLQVVGLAHLLRRQLAGLAHRHEAGVEVVGHDGGEHEAPRLDAHHLLDALLGEQPDEAVDRHAQRQRVLQEGRDVVEQDARLREVRDLADMGLQIVHALSSSDR